MAVSYELMKDRHVWPAPHFVEADEPEAPSSVLLAYLGAVLTDNIQGSEKVALWLLEVVKVITPPFNREMKKIEQECVPYVIFGIRVSSTHHMTI